MTQKIKLSELSPNNGQIEGLPANPRLIKDERFQKLKKSLQDDPEMLELRELLVFEHEGEKIIVGGNMRYRAAADLGIEELPCKIIPPETPVEKLRAILIKDNIAYGEYDWDMLANDWDASELEDWGVDVWQDETSDDGNGESSDAKKNGSLTDRFVIPPFSILDTRKGYWQARKKLWREIIGDMGESRTDTLITAYEIKYKDLYQRTREHRESLGIGFKEYVEKYVPADVLEKEAAKVLSAGVSLFDPVLSEIVCRWFTPAPGSKIFDCCAGDTQKGLVFGQCGYEFTGIELRQEQVDINNRVIADRGLPVRYICDDGQNVANHIEAASQDLFFCCPPYWNLEVYSDMANDASNQASYGDFLAILANAFKNSLACLKDDRFAVVVVGDVRDKKTGFYHNFVDDVKRIFTDNVAALYNELILVETGASTALRASRYMDTRKVAKMHQNVLVFFKGNPKNIGKIFPKIEFSSEELAMFDQEAGNDGDSSEGDYLPDRERPPEPLPQGTPTRTVADTAGQVRVKISGKWIKHKFRCSEDYIRNVCHGSCCTGSNKVLISLLPEEAERQKQIGLAVKDSKLQASPTTRKCPHIQTNGLCKLHLTPDKPFGCIASPFTLNTARTLVLRNRYNMMKCHGSGDYAYRVFRASLDIIFGAEEAQRICDYYDHHDGDLTAYIPRENYDKIVYLDSLKH